jgi:hypothetical protein
MHMLFSSTKQSFLVFFSSELYVRYQCCAMRRMAIAIVVALGMNRHHRSPAFDHTDQLQLAPAEK